MVCFLSTERTTRGMNKSRSWE